MKSVAILGCGPTGLMVAHAAELSGWDFHVYSRKQKSKLYGAQYLHQPIPNLDCGLPKMVRYELRGTPEAYRRKVYGDSWDGKVSPEDLMESHSAWDLREAYDHLWREYGEEIKHFEMFGNSPDALARQILGHHDLVISTVPRKIWAQPGDVFESTKVWALGDTEMPRVEPPYRPDEFTVFCEADIRIPWYRISNIYGYCTIEWPFVPDPYVPDDDDERALIPAHSVWQTPPVKGCSIVEKPLRHNSTAASDFVHLGRYGAWEKGVLTSDAFFEAMKVLARDAIS